VLELSPRSPQHPELRDIPVDPALLAAGDHNGATYYQHARFLELLRGQRRTPEVTAQDGWRAVEMGLAAQRAIETGLPVSLVQDRAEISA
jgi:hypothetical protein